MARVIDITEKLNFDSKPKIKVNDIEVEVNNSAISMLKIMPKLESPTNSDLILIYETLFAEKEREKIEALDLDMKNFTAFISEAIVVVTGSGEESEGETATPATT